jgi:outer membrane cobalamin receptor
VPIIWAALSRLPRASDTVTRSHAVFAALTLLGFACAAPQISRGAGDSQLITEDEIEASRAPTAYEVIQKLRANFLAYRGETSFNKSNSQPYPTVYIDGQEFGPISSLRNIPASQVATIRLYRSWEATTKYGTGNIGGVIAVTTRQ